MAPWSAVRSKRPRIRVRASGQGWPGGCRGIAHRVTFSHLSHLLSHPAVVLCELAVATCAFPQFLLIRRAAFGCFFE